MKLYHYTANHHLFGGPGHPGPGIVFEGILPNVHPYVDIAGGLVWLTSSDKWEQSWSSRDVPVPGYGSCRRTESRLLITIPKSHRSALSPWSDARRFVLTDELRADLETYGDPEHWWVFAGRIPPNWIRTFESLTAL